MKEVKACRGLRVDLENLENLDKKITFQNVTENLETSGKIFEKSLL